jgi:hypothetical protein
MVETKSIAELADLAKQLNSRSDNINKSIKALNDQLAPLNLGLEFWHPRPIISSGLRYRRYPGVVEPERYEVDTYLGYSKLENEWQLAINETTTTYEWDEDEREQRSVEEMRYCPLLKASRDVRLAGVSCFDELIARLVDHTKEQLKTIQKAEKIARLNAEMQCICTDRGHDHDAGRCELQARAGGEKCDKCEGKIALQAADAKPQGRQDMPPPARSR